MWPLPELLLLPLTSYDQSAPFQASRSQVFCEMNGAQLVMSGNLQLMPSASSEVKQDVAAQQPTSSQKIETSSMTLRDPQHVAYT